MNGQFVPLPTRTPGRNWKLLNRIRQTSHNHKLKSTTSSSRQKSAQPRRSIHKRKRERGNSIKYNNLKCILLLMHASPTSTSPCPEKLHTLLFNPKTQKFLHSEVNDYTATIGRNAFALWWFGGGWRWRWRHIAEQLPHYGSVLLTLCLFIFLNLLFMFYELRVNLALIISNICQNTVSFQKMNDLKKTNFLA